jgi:hypothetical protein
VALSHRLRFRIQQIIDRHFCRSRYCVARTGANFNAWLRDEVDLNALWMELQTTVHETSQPTHALL